MISFTLPSSPVRSRAAFAVVLASGLLPAIGCAQQTPAAAPIPPAVAPKPIEFENLDAPQTITVTDKVVARNPEPFGANVSLGDVNNWTKDPSFEPIVLRYRFTANSGGADFITTEGGAGLSVWGTIGDGFFDGAHVRVYRFVGGAMKPVRTGVVKEYLATQNRLPLTEAGAAVQKGDIFFLAMNPTNAPVDKVNARMKRSRDGDTWEGHNGVRKTRDDSTQAPEMGGRSSLKLSSDKAEEVGIKQYRYGDPARYFATLTPERQYTVTAWLKQQGIPGGKVRFWMNGAYKRVDHTWEGVTGDWKKVDFQRATASQRPQRAAVPDLQGAGHAVGG